jgi:hypothetical protein
LSIFKVKLIPPTEATTATYGRLWGDPEADENVRRYVNQTPKQAQRIYDKAFNAILKETKNMICLGEDEDGFMVYQTK